MIIKILHKDWNISVLKKKKYAKKWGTDSVAMCDAKKRTIDLIKGHADYETILHELVHCFYSELSFYELQLDDDQQEEWVCEMISKYYVLLGELAIQIFNHANSPDDL